MPSRPFSWWIPNKNTFPPVVQWNSPDFEPETPCLRSAFCGLKEWAGFGALVPLILTWFIFFFFPIPLFPPVLILCLYLVYDPVLEYRDKLFTHSNQKPGSKERVHQQGTVHLSHSVCLHLPPGLLLLLFALACSLTRSCTAFRRAYRHLVRRLTNCPCGFSLRGLCVGAEGGFHKAGRLL